MPVYYSLCLLVIAFSAPLVAPCLRAQSPPPPSPPETGNWQEVSIDLPYAGVLQRVTTHDVAGYPWSVGGETMDRDYTLYDNWKEYVEPLGITQVRLQSGWAKTEQTKGQYDFAWLDYIVRDLVKRGVKPWISLSYGNPNYTGGGGTLLGARLPTSGEAYQGWQNYVRATVDRYKDVVDTWEIWNEPNNRHYGESNGPEDYGKMIVTTARIIRALQPQATIIAFASVGHASDWTGETLAYLRDQQALDLVDLVSYHPYSHNPDATQAETQRLRDTVAAYSPRLRLYQGENGAPSEYRETKALSGYPWTELSQAKWYLRRALNDRGQNIGTSIFSMADLQYPDEINRKGLLLTNESKEVVRPKHAYSAVQHLVSVFDADLNPTEELEFTDDTYHGIRAYRFAGSRGAVVALWFSDNVPSDYNGTTPVDFTFSGLPFEDPVYVDLRTGVVYDIPGSHRRLTEAGQEFYDLPVYDSPTLIAERSALTLRSR